MSTVNRISFEELAENLAGILGKVRDEHTTVVVEYASGEKLIIKPLLPTRPGIDEEEIDATPQQPPQRTSNTENISSVGAVFDLDPNSITPG